jgi:hypothetical protein
MTIARIVDVVWTSPHGERAAMVTEPGTVHILDLPASAFTWPPPRRRGPSQKPDEGAGELPVYLSRLLDWRRARSVLSGLLHNPL